MARRKTSKSDHIRAALAELGPEARNRDVIEKLAGAKISVSAQMVSTVRARVGAAATSNGSKHSGRPKRRSSETMSLAALLSAKRLVMDSGSVEGAKQTLAALALLV